MSTNITIISGLQSAKAGTSSLSSYEYTTSNLLFSSQIIEVGNIDETLQAGDITQPKAVFMQLMSGDPVLIGFVTASGGGGVYPMGLSTKNSSMVFELNSSSVRQTAKLVPQANVASSLSGKYFDIYSRSEKVRSWFSMIPAKATGRIGAFLNDFQGRSSAKLTIAYVRPGVGESVTINGKTYTFVNTLTSPAVEGEVLIDIVSAINGNINIHPSGGGLSAAINLMDAINHLEGEDLFKVWGNGVTYSCAAAHPDVTVTERLLNWNQFPYSSILTITAKTVGINAYPLSHTISYYTTTTSISAWSSATMIGGAVSLGSVEVAGAELKRVRENPNADNLEFSTVAELANLINFIPELTAKIVPDSLNTANFFIDLEFNTIGSAGNSFTLADNSCLGVSVSGNTLTGGADATTPLSAEAGTRLVEILVSANSNVARINEAIRDAFVGDPDLTVSATASSVTFTDNYFGVRTSPSSSNITAWAPIEIVLSGQAPPTIHLKSLGTSVLQVTAVPE